MSNDTTTTDLLPAILEGLDDALGLGGYRINAKEGDFGFDVLDLLDGLDLTDDVVAALDGLEVTGYLDSRTFGDGWNEPRETYFRGEWFITRGTDPRVIVSGTVTCEDGAEPSGRHASLMA